MHFASTSDHRRALVTQDLGDFRPLLGEALRAGRKIYGLVCVSLSRESIGRLVASLELVLRTHPGEEDLINRGGEVWLVEALARA